MLDVLVPIVLASAASGGIMWLLDLMDMDKPSGQKESRARSGARARHKG